MRRSHDKDQIDRLEEVKIQTALPHCHHNTMLLDEQHTV